jgi:transposase
VAVVINHEQEEPSAVKVRTVGLDLAKNVFQVHGIDGIGKVLVRRTLRRRQVIGELEKDLKASSRGNEVVRRLKTIPGIGPITASALAASVTDPYRFGSARQFVASFGLTPRANSSGGKERMGRISKMGDRYLRCLLVNGMTSQLQAARRKPEAHPWVNCLLRRRPHSLDKVRLI